jgi:hypothetical protein
MQHSRLDHLVPDETCSRALLPGRVGDLPICGIDQGGPMGTRKRDADYSAAVIHTLVSEFSNLTDPTTAVIVREAVARHANQPDTAFECIIDDPILANWRLRPHREQPSRVRVACYRLNPTQADNDREQRVNHALNLIPA